jgi:multiple sugar transport system ATP-binding protein
MPHDGKSIIFGIRPEDIHNPNFAPPGIQVQPVSAKVDVSELLGNEILVYLKTGANSFVARVDPRSRYQIDDDVQMVFNMENIHIFDKETEQAIR